MTLLVLPRLNGNVQYSTTFHLLKPIDQRACSSNDPTAAASPDIGGGFLRTFLDGATPISPARPLPMAQRGPR